MVCPSFLPRLWGASANRRPGPAVLFVSSGYTVPSYVVNGLNIHDIEIVSDPAPATRPPPAPKYSQAPLQAPPLVVHTPPAPAPQLYPTNTKPLAHGKPFSYQAPITGPPAASEFVDPAIVSMSRKPTAAQAPPPAPTIPQPSFSTPPRISASLAATRLPNGPTAKRPGSSHGSNLSLNTLGMSPVSKAHPYSANAAVEPLRSSARLGPQSESRAPASASAALSVPFGDLSLKGDVAAESSAFDETDDGLGSVLPVTPEVRGKLQGKRSRRGKPHLKRQHEQREDGNVVAPGMFRGSIAQVANASASHLMQPGMTNRRRRTRRGNRYDGSTTNAEEEGWATEDVNDYKEREFDFQGNLDRFDKKTVFNQIKVGTIPHALSSHAEVTAGRRYHRRFRPPGLVQPSPAAQTLHSQKELPPSRECPRGLQ